MSNKNYSDIKQMDNTLIATGLFHILKKTENSDRNSSLICL